MCNTSTNHVRPGCVGVLLAAGRGRRMGTTKQLLAWPAEWGPSTVVAASFDVLAPYCERVVVVLGHEGLRVAAALGEDQGGSRDFETVMVDANLPMMESARAGLRYAMEELKAREVLLHPADHPSVNQSTMKHLMEACEQYHDHVCMPEYQGKGGHPVFIPRDVALAVLCWQGEGGLRAYWREIETRVRRIPVDDDSAVMDLDTPEDYQRLRE